VAAHVETFAQRLGSYPDWPELDEMDACVIPAVPESDRPAETDDPGKATADALLSAVRRGMASLLDGTTGAPSASTSPDKAA
jgi:glutathione-regulated potassium-efflux system ancillary protein KefF